MVKAPRAEHSAVVSPGMPVDGTDVGRWPITQHRRLFVRTALFPGRLTQLVTPAVEPTPFGVIYEENKTRLRHYEPADEPNGTPVLIVYAFINTPAILDLSESRSIVGHFLDAGMDVTVVDWGRPSRLDVHLTLDDYVGRYLDNCVTAACEHASTAEVHLVGISTGSPLAATYAALNPDRVASLTLQGPPLEFDASGGMLDFEPLVEAIDPDCVVESLGNLPKELMDAGFSLRKPVDYQVSDLVDFWDNLEDETYVEHTGRVMRWSSFGPDLAGATYSQFVEEFLRQNKLLEDCLTIRDEPVELDSIDMPVALILGEDDAFVPHEASLPFLDAIPSEETTVFWLPGDHVETLVGEQAHEEHWPAIVDWIQHT